MRKVLRCGDTDYFSFTKLRSNKFTVLRLKYLTAFSGFVYYDQRVWGYLKVALGSWDTNELLSKNTPRWCALVCIGLHWCALVCIGLHWSAVVCGRLRSSALVRIGVHWSAVVCIRVRSCALVCIGVRSSAVVCGRLHSSAVVCIRLRSSALVCIGLRSKRTKSYDLTSVCYQPHCRYLTLQPHIKSQSSRSV